MAENPYVLIGSGLMQVRSVTPLASSAANLLAHEAGNGCGYLTDRPG